MTTKKISPTPRQHPCKGNINRSIRLCTGHRSLKAHASRTGLFFQGVLIAVKEGGGIHIADGEEMRVHPQALK